ncbi:GFA family protein [Cocleimonas sp. KMM 6892]|uniref:GFA family protein n=1 Tax=unclassified Cocleimonas TaxID=2639732 RepID=UPI002DBC1A37|nr:MULTISPECIES: GFA family protein [unclassified Cocleimonas]MEB8432209.1 GFA family protein [Cocleimonas sp. KMM 6892]MEC4714705.1 GFA family protein [Cocleimonas sp. KMM 6895]MEC4744481.1 GFA family protein [Cocleimonas sp. KMM 6896]
MTTYSGQCLCASIKYEVSKIEPKMGHCHCSMCRKFHGSAFATFGEAKRENFKWVEGEEHLQSYTADNGTIRKFCPTCGSSLIFQDSIESTELVEFALGTLDSDIELKPDVHIFVSSKANWLDIKDDLPQFSGNRRSNLINDNE